jgi:hypothetical protein
MGRDLDRSFDGELKDVENGILSLDIPEELALRDPGEAPQLAYVPPDALEALADDLPSSTFEDPSSSNPERPIADRLEAQIAHDGLGHQALSRLFVIGEQELSVSQDPVTKRHGRVVEKYEIDPIRLQHSHQSVHQLAARRLPRSAGSQQHGDVEVAQWSRGAPGSRSEKISERDPPVTAQEIADGFLQL